MLKITTTLNSLCGISLNATEGAVKPYFTFRANISQFPLWDFFECNILTMNVINREKLSSLNSLCGISLNATVGDFAFEVLFFAKHLSIPFVGFL